MSGALEHRKCLLCWDSDHHHIGWGACAAISSWDNYANGYERVVKNDSIELWPLFVCEKCLVLGHGRYLSKEKGASRRELFLLPLRGLGIIVLGGVAAAVGSAFLSVRMLGGYPIGMLGGLSIVIGALILLIGLIRIPKEVKHMKSLSRTAEVLKNNQTVPEQEVVSALKGVSELILYSLESCWEVPEDIRLPAFREHNVGVEVKKRREILGAAKSRDELLASLDHKWKDLLEINHEDST